MYLAINALLAHSAGNELSVLRSEVQDYDEFVVQKKIAPDVRPGSGFRKTEPGFLDK